MSLGELLLTLLIALLVFGPERLPSVARHLGKLLGYANRYKQLALQWWEEQKKELQLQENIKKAEKIEKKRTDHGCV